MKSYFITGTDTDVGKTIITAGLARCLVDEGINLGVMKPFAAADIQHSEFKSEDVEILSKAAKVNDPESLLNPQFFEIPASPYTASQNLGVEVDIEVVKSSYNKLLEKHEMMLVEGMGGILVPITKNYYVTHLIKEMNLDAILVTRTKIGAVNHALMSWKICQDFDIPLKGIIINSFDSEGYPADELKRDLEDLTGVPVLGIIPRIDDLNIDNVAKIISKEIDLNQLKN